jgi:hypothetical protein
MTLGALERREPFIERTVLLADYTAYSVVRTAY